jgi:membrane protein DedA with SNARE-associated domain
MVGGYFLGSFIDSKLDSHPLWSVVTILAALVLGIAYLALMARKLFMSEADGSQADEAPNDE